MSTGKTKLRLSTDDLTLEDMEDFEAATGKDLMQALKPQPVIDETTGRPVKDPNDPKGRPLMEARMTTKVFGGLIFLALRRDDPNLTYQDVRKMPLSTFDFEIEQPDDVDPTEVSDETQSGKS